LYSRQDGRCIAIRNGRTGQKQDERKYRSPLSRAVPDVVSVHDCARMRRDTRLCVDECKRRKCCNEECGDGLARKGKPHGICVCVRCAAAPARLRNCDHDVRLFDMLHGCPGELCKRCATVSPHEGNGEMDRWISQPRSSVAILHISDERVWLSVTVAPIGSLV
jgi:hypothetical protein